MGITKTEGFSSKVTKMAEVLKAVGHPARLSIMLYLAKQTSCVCNNIVDKLPLAQPTISRHLSELKRVGLIQGTIEGKNVCYCINRENWGQVRDTIENITRTIDNQKKCCEDSQINSTT